MLGWWEVGGPRWVDGALVTPVHCGDKGVGKLYCEEASPDELGTYDEGGVDRVMGPPWNCMGCAFPPAIGVLSRRVALTVGAGGAGAVLLCLRLRRRR
jgi:hypothetical protein